MPKKITVCWWVFFVFVCWLNVVSWLFFCFVLLLLFFFWGGGGGGVQGDILLLVLHLLSSPSPLPLSLLPPPLLSPPSSLSFSVSVIDISILFMYAWPEVGRHMHNFVSLTLLLSAENGGSGSAAVWDDERHQGTLPHHQWAGMNKCAFLLYHCSLGNPFPAKASSWWWWWSLLHSAVLRSRADSLRSHVILHEWLAFYSAFLNIHRSGVLTALAWLVPHETAVSAQVLCTPYNHAPCHFMQSHICKVYACLAALSAEWPGSFTCYCSNTGVERILK